MQEGKNQLFCKQCGREIDYKSITRPATMVRNSNSTFNLNNTSAAIVYDDYFGCSRCNLWLPRHRLYELTKDKQANWYLIDLKKAVDDHMQEEGRKKIAAIKLPEWED